MRLLSAGGPGLAEYGGGYPGLARVTVDPGWLRAEVAASGLRGRGGAAFPVSRKWETAMAFPGPRCLVVNGGEDEPGSLKDRYLMATRPHLVLEGALASAWAIGAERVVLYVSGGAPELAERMSEAVAEAADAGLLGEISVSVVGAPDTYVAGEDSCAVEFIESDGARAQPRKKPPFPAEAGLWGRPTVVSNVETLAHVAVLAREGADWFRQRGTPGHPGTLLVTIPGECARPGVYEVESGAYLDEVLGSLAGGPAGAAFRAAQVGGPAAGWLPAGDLHIALDPDVLAAKGTMLGCAAVRLLPEDRCAVDAVAEVEAPGAWDTPSPPIWPEPERNWCSSTSTEPPPSGPSRNSTPRVWPSKPTCPARPISTG